MTAETPTVDAATPVDGRCPASVMPGQRCGRAVAAGETLCENHLAMGSPTSAGGTER
jgi:hypothetical protein